MTRARLLGALVAGAMLAGAGPAHSIEILFLHVASYAPYVDDGNRIAADVAGAAGVTNLEERYLDQAVYNDLDQFDQVWVYDLYAGADNSAIQQQNYTNIANWYNNLAAADQNLIVDGRIISSDIAWKNPPETAYLQNYVGELDERGGGLMMGTDHNVFANGGFNSILAQMGIDPVVGISGGPLAVVDPLSPLWIPGLIPCGANTCINDNSSTGFVPTGVQPNGQELTPAAWHGTILDAFDQAAVSTTFGSETFGTCGNPGQPVCDPNTVPEPALPLLLGAGLVGLLVRRRQRPAAR